MSILPNWNAIDGVSMDDENDYAGPFAPEDGGVSEQAARRFTNCSCAFFVALFFLLWLGSWAYVKAFGYPPAPQEQADTTRRAVKGGDRNARWK